MYSLATLSRIGKYIGIQAVTVPIPAGLTPTLRLSGARPAFLITAYLCVTTLVDVC